MKTKHLIILLFSIVCMNLCGCHTGHDRDSKMNDNTPSSEIGQGSSNVDGSTMNKIIGNTEDQVSMNHAEKTAKLSLVISIICLIICIFASITSRYEIKKIHDFGDNTDHSEGPDPELSKMNKSLSIIKKEVNDLKQKLEDIEYKHKAKDQDSSPGVLDYGQEITLQSYRKKYFGTAIRLEGESGYFYDADEKGEPRMFVAEITDNQALFKPLSYESLAYENSNLAIDFTGTADRNSYHRMNTIRDGQAEYNPNDGRWHIKVKAQVELS